MQRIEELRKQIMVLEWDQQRNQLNANKVGYLNKLKEELTLLQQTVVEPAVEESEESSMTELSNRTEDLLPG